MTKTQVEVEELDEKQENDEPRITVMEEYEIFLIWNNGTVSILINIFRFMFKVIHSFLMMYAEINVIK